MTLYSIWWDSLVTKNFIHRVLVSSVKFAVASGLWTFCSLIRHANVHVAIILHFGCYWLVVKLIFCIISGLEVLLAASVKASRLEASILSSLWASRVVCMCVCVWGHYTAHYASRPSVVCLALPNWEGHAARGCLYLTFLSCLKLKNRTLKSNVSVRE